MELRHLRYFIAVAEELHFGRAAQRLSIEQPPLSQQIQQLERELGFALLLRTKRRVELTEAGAAFLEEARSLLASLEKAAAESRRIARGEVGWLGVGFVGTATYGILPAILSAFRQGYPEVELTLRELVSGRQVQALRDRRIHVGLARPAIAEAGIRSEPLLREALCVALPAAHPLAERRSSVLEWLASEPFVLFPRHPRPSYAAFILSVCAEAGFAPQVVQEVAEMHTALALVAAGIGVTLVPESVCRVQREGVVFRPLEEPAPFSELTLAYREEDATPTLQAFLRAAREVAQAYQRKGLP